MKILVFCPHGKDVKKYANFETEIFKLDEAEIENSSSDEQYVFNSVKDCLELNNQVSGIIISYHCTIKHSLNIICSIRLLGQESDSILPIIWESTEQFENVTQNFAEYGKTITISNNLRFFHVDSYHNDEKLHKEMFDVFKSFEYKEEMDILIYPTKGSSHQITNEWGAYILAYSAKLYHLLSEIEKMRHAKSLYFKYLQRKNKIDSSLIETSITAAETEKTKKYLLVDDNYDKGWELVFSAILGNIDPSLGLSSFKNFGTANFDVDNVSSEIVEEIKTQKHQGVLLDLRLTADDDKPDKNYTNVENLTGGKVLKNLKNEFPYLPIIIVTASNKAWNMSQLIDLGADGYFIKESPEIDVEKAISKSNYESFRQLIIASQKKFAILSPFWEHIKEIRENGTLIEERHMPDGTQTKVEERIKERLMMFFGLIKRSFEDTSYNQQFYYSEISLAFMTLWSCLNDIQYIYYDKTPWDSTNNKRVQLRIESYLVNGDNSAFLQVRKGNTNSVKVSITGTHESAPYFKLIDLKFINKNYSQSIGEQIAFLLFKLGNLEEGDKLLENLYLLKEKRNENYFTHGDDSIGSGFYTSTESEMGTIYIDDCKNLFEIVYFLLKKEKIMF